MLYEAIGDQPPTHENTLLALQPQVLRQCFGLTNQLRRASVSVASNIAEGYGRSTRGEYRLFLGHARGSNFEIQTQLTIADGLNFGTKHLRNKSQNLSEEVSRMLVAMMTRLKE